MSSQVKELTNLPKLLKPTDVKKYLNIGSDKLYELLRQKNFPSLKIGCRFYIIEDEFIEWLNKQTKKSY